MVQGQLRGSSNTETLNIFNKNVYIHIYTYTMYLLQAYGTWPGPREVFSDSNYLSIQHHQSCFFNPHVSCLTSQALLVKKQFNHDQKPPGHFCWFPMASMDVQSLFSVGFSFVFPPFPKAQAVDHPHVPPRPALHSPRLRCAARCAPTNSRARSIRRHGSHRSLRDRSNQRSDFVPSKCPLIWRFPWDYTQMVWRFP